ncbi:ATP-binding protein [Actinacidiphila sp. DG2A-62]|uniref:ATP-binding protein n=1 Tax=Actinacidiphila sp. DG2A-62 TaxID=3108821 RepID=UPI002DBCFC04|nr:ATP-binding protein [Actinacidiphila sp. DG2A-62]MEC3995271.1 ATP-binding protein [Actinacidiphila sp. DG2A-62]
MLQPVTREFLREAVAVPEARSFVRDVLDAWGVSERCDDVLTCVSELATNVVRHDETHGRSFHVALSGRDGLLRIEVHDASRRHPVIKSPGADSTTGRGLLLVNELSDGWGVEPQDPRGKVVWTEFKIAAAQGVTRPW